MFCMKHHYDDSNDNNGNKSVGVPSVMKYMINLEYDTKSSLQSYLSCDKIVGYFRHMSCVSTCLTKQTHSNVIFTVTPLCSSTDWTPDTVKSRAGIPWPWYTNRLRWSYTYGYLKTIAKACSMTMIGGYWELKLRVYAEGTLSRAYASGYRFDSKIETYIWSAGVSTTVLQ